MAAHARLQPSKAKTWLNCPGSVALSANVVDEGSEYADEGTACHEICEQVLNGKPWPLPGSQMSNGVKVTEEMLRLCRVNVEWVRDYQDATGAVLHLEQRVEIGTVLKLPEGVCFGTSDVVGLVKDEMLIADHKFGYNAVDVRGNEQLILYAIGGLAKFGNTKRVRLAILQPKCGDPSEHVYTLDEIIERVRDFRPKAEAAHKGGPLVPSDDACRWCKAKPVCPALREEMLALARREFEENVMEYTPEDLGDLLTKLEMLEPAAKSIRNHALKLMELGTEIPGWKRVKGDTKEKWLDEDEKKVAAKLKKMGVQPFEQSLVSPANAREQIVEILVGAKKEKTKKAAREAAREILASIAGKPEGRPTLAKSGDPRPALPAEFTADDVARLEAEEQGID